MAVKKLSISVSEETEANARDLVENGKYRNLSHLFEEGAKLIFAKEG
jgi:Arc/MetJ-type ribon-helix-helix transcriptional regulator